MPSQAAQERLLVRLHESARLDPRDTTFVEVRAPRSRTTLKIADNLQGHGTGTKAGDPIDAGAIASVVAKEASLSNPTYIGSVKSNFGSVLLLAKQLPSVPNKASAIWKGPVVWYQ